MMMKVKLGVLRCLFSNFDAQNTAILGLKCREVRLDR